MTALLEVEDLAMRFGGLTAIAGVSFQAHPNQITAIIGPNGAGKTTLFNCLTGFYRPSAGRITLNGLPLERLADHQIARQARIARTFQNIRLFPMMTVLENLMVARHAPLMKASLFSVAGLLGLKRYRDAEADAIEVARRWLDRFDLTAFADTEAGALPHGKQRHLEIARALCTDPVLLCLDEPAAGLNPRETAELTERLADLRRTDDIAMLLIEHDMSVVMGVSDHIVVLDHGRKIAEGSPFEIKRDPAVIRAYLGETDDEALPPDVAGDVAC